MKIDIAVGHSASSLKWKHKSVTWEAFRKKLAEPVITRESFKQYQAATRDERSKIKDVGGYVGGYLRGGRRKPENLVNRQLITLDVDFGHMDFWDDFTLFFNQTAVVHSTHSHCEETPKFRLIIPLDREVTADEYVAIGRRIAGDLDIELFDNTGFQPYRLMFWPSVSKDVEYYYRFQDGPVLSADRVLERYKDWTDSSLWPISESVKGSIKKGIGKQENPLEKKGLIGAFCRSYTIEDAIGKFLSDVYTDAKEDRFTYIGGSTSGGLVVYDELFAYSHHGTDPTGGHLCNAFDLVRMHKFLHLDTSPNSKNSLNAMQELCRQDPEVKRLVLSETFILDDDDYEDASEEVEDLSWTEEIELDKNGKPLSSSKNLDLLLNNAKALKGVLAHNELLSAPYIMKRPPWEPNWSGPRRLRDSDFSGFRVYFETMFKIESRTKIDDAINMQLIENSFHPVKNYLEATKWDGNKRVDTVMVDYLGAEDTEYVRQATAKFFLGAVARIFNPGCKFDLVLTLIGPQGAGKSAIFIKLGGEWFSDSFFSVQGKEALGQIQGSWIVEMAELTGMRKAEVEATKHFLTKQVDVFRPAYGRVSQEFKRQCVFVGTTNTDDFLRDSTGNRRFLPVRVHPENAILSVFDDMDKPLIAQLWAEAVHRYKGGESLFLTVEQEADANENREEFREVDPRTSIVEQFLDIKLPENWSGLFIPDRLYFLDDNELEGVVTRDRISRLEVWVECLRGKKKDFTPMVSRDMTKILDGLKGWESGGSNTKRSRVYGRQRYYSRIKK